MTKVALLLSDNRSWPKMAHRPDSVRLPCGSVGSLPETALKDGERSQQIPKDTC